MVLGGLPHAGGVADVVAQHLGDDRGGHTGVGGPAGVDDLVAEGVEGAGDAGPDPPRSQHGAVVGGRGGELRGGDARPLAGEGGVQQGGGVDEVGRPSTGRQAVEGGVHPEADDPDLSVVVDQDVLGDQPSVRQPGGVRQGEAVGHLGDDPRGAARLQRSVVGQHDVERGPLAPLVDDEAEVVEPLGVQDAQQAGVEVGGHVAGRLQESLGPRVVAGDEVHGDVPVQDGVVGAPEAAALALGEQVVEAVARGEDLAGVDRVRHRSPRSRRLPAGRWTTSS